MLNECKINIKTAESLRFQILYCQTNFAKFNSLFLDKTPFARFCEKMVRIEPDSDRLKAAEAINEVVGALKENNEKEYDVRKDGIVGGIKDDTHKKREKILAQKLIQNRDETQVGFRQKVFISLEKVKNL